MTTNALKLGDIITARFPEIYEEEYSEELKLKIAIAVSQTS